MYAAGKNADLATPLPKHQEGQPTMKHQAKRVLVTGAGSGFGREIILAFAKRGAEAICVDLNLDTAEQTAAMARELGVTAHAYQADVSSETVMTALAEQVCNEVGLPDVVVNNAGIGMAGGLLETDFASWQKVMGVNFWSVIYGSKLFAERMVAAKQPGAIVNIASAAAFTPNRTIVAYSTGKAAVRMFSDCIRADLHRHNIHVVCCCPGFSNTGIVENTSYEGMSAEEQAKAQAAAKKLYARRNLKPEAIAHAVVNAVEKGKAEALVGAEAHGSDWLGRVSPGLKRLAARLDLTPK